MSRWCFRPPHAHWPKPRHRGRARPRPEGSPLNTSLIIEKGPAARRVRLVDYLDAQGEERAAERAIAWIKSLRTARVDGAPFRERFMYGRDSLWWFAELYLHKERAIVSAFRTVHATRALIDRESPDIIRLEEADDAARIVVPQVAAARRIEVEADPPAHARGRLLRMDARSTALMMGALASPRRPWSRRPEGKATVAAFVHRAFWRGQSAEGGAESYIGPVLDALEELVPAGHLRYVGVGPALNFKARRWWKRGPSGPAAVEPIETFAPRTALAGSSGLWAARHAIRRSLLASADLRAASRIDECDWWPIVSEALDGVALLQFPWSARAIDEAGAALDALAPDVALTYAEAGGWGRALAIAARQRRIPLAGLQHGFIYRHWLNYLHEPDEMRPTGGSDSGFPRPDATLLFDEHAARHLRERGRFPDGTLKVTGSPRLDQLAAEFRRLGDEEVAVARRSAGVDASRAMVLLVTKFSEVRSVLDALLRAIRSMPAAQLVIKPHPAETAEPYERAAEGIANVRILSAAAPLATLMRASRALVTVNSTVALDGLALGVPSLAIGLPNNLSPFVESGAIAGAATPDEIGPALERLLYDEEFRQHLLRMASALAAEWRMTPDGGAARRSADAVLSLARSSAGPRATRGTGQE